MINLKAKLTISRQCQLLSLSRSSFYSHNKAVSQQELDLMLAIDKIHLELPFYGTRKIQVELNNRGFSVGREKVRRLMRKMGLEAIYRKPKTSVPKAGNHIYPYLLKNLQIDRANNRKENLVLYGNVGAGKTHMATAIGVNAWNSGKEVKFFRTAALVNYLSEQKAKGNLTKALKAINKATC